MAKRFVVVRFEYGALWYILDTVQMVLLDKSHYEYETKELAQREADALNEGEAA